MQAVRDALRGVSYVTLQIAKAVEKSYIRDLKLPERPRHLSDRQREVLQMLRKAVQ